MRIISGKYRGKKLFAPKDNSVRPTTDRVKEAMFDMLQFKVRGAVVLDLFGGSGALGVECASRGAKYVVECDNDSDSVNLIKRNFEGVEYDGEIVKCDFLKIISQKQIKYDIIFLDPPYKSDSAYRALTAIAQYDRLSDDGVVIYERDMYSSMPPVDGFFVADSRRYGETVLDIIKKV